MPPRVYWKKLGGHVHCRMFTKGRNGTLVFGEEEWEFVKMMLEKGGFDVRPDDEAA